MAETTLSAQALLERLGEARRIVSVLLDSLDPLASPTADRLWCGLYDSYAMLARTTQVAEQWQREQDDGQVRLALGEQA